MKTIKTVGFVLELGFKFRALPPCVTAAALAASPSARRVQDRGACTSKWAAKRLCVRVCVCVFSRRVRRDNLSASQPVLGRRRHRVLGPGIPRAGNPLVARRRR